MCECSSEDNEDEKLPGFKFLHVEMNKADLHLRAPVNESATSTSEDTDTRDRSTEDSSCACSGNDVSEQASGSTEATACTCDDDNLCQEAGVAKTPTADEEPCAEPCDCTEESDIWMRRADSEEPLPAPKRLEYTLAIIKPEATMYRKHIEAEIRDEGFLVSQTRWLRLTPEQVSDFYEDSRDEDMIRRVAYMSSAPIVILVLAKINAVEDWKQLMGPEKVSEAKIYVPDSIRGKYGRAGDDMQNVVHGSLSSAAALREIHFFFPSKVIEPIVSGEAAVDYMWQEMHEALLEGLIKCCELQPEDPQIWLAHWLLDNNPRKPKYLW